jgi:hypothetical protein
MSKRNKGKKRGSINTSKYKWSGADPRVNDFFGQVGLRRWYSIEAFYKYLQRTYGATGMRLIDVMHSEDDGDDVIFHNLRNTNLELALDISGQRFGNFYKEYLNWWLRENLPIPKRLLDIGCNCGILTCFYATLYPDAEIIGIDKCVPAVKRARELANKLGLKNVRFEVHDLHDPFTLKPDRDYDLITTTTVMHEAVAFPHDLSWGLENIDLDQGMEPLRQILTIIQSLLKAGSGLLISVDRHPIPSFTARWVRALNRANLQVIWDKSYMLPWVDEEEDVQTFTLTVSFPDTSPPQDIDKVLALVGAREFTEKMQDPVLEGSAAELLFRTFSNKRLVFGIEVDILDSNESWRMEIWRNNEIALVYEYSINWYRAIDIHCALVIQELIQRAILYAESKYKYEKFKISEDGGPYEDAAIEKDDRGNLSIVKSPPIAGHIQVQNKCDKVLLGVTLFSN